MRKTIKIFCGALIAALFLALCTAGFAQTKAYFNGDAEKPRIAITMDDCWKIGNVQKMLDLCREYGFHMTFFPCGVNIREAERDVWQQMLKDGHEIGNHTQNHRKLTALPVFRVRKEIKEMQETLNRVLGYAYPIRLLRPPYGSYRDKAGFHTVRVIRQTGYDHIILWSLSQTDPDQMLKKVKNGDILLYHANKKDVEGLKKAIPVLLDRGFELVTVSELLGLDSKDTQAQTSQQ